MRKGAWEAPLLNIILAVAVGFLILYGLAKTLGVDFMKG